MLCHRRWRRALACSDPLAVKQTDVLSNATTGLVSIEAASSCGRLRRCPFRQRQSAKPPAPRMALAFVALAQARAAGAAIGLSAPPPTCQAAAGGPPPALGAAALL